MGPVSGIWEARQFAVKLVAWYDSDAETLLVTVPVAEPPVLTKGDHVVVEGLEAMPWVSNGNVRVAFRAKSILPLNGSGAGSK